MDDLTDDLLVEVLVRVQDPAALFRCAAACKRWRRLIADPQFLRRSWPPERAYHPSSLLGFMDERGADGDAPFVPAPRSALGPERRSLGSFAPHATGLLRYAMVAASCPGLLLLRTGSPRTCDHPYTPLHPAVLRYVVCNPLSSTCHVLPALHRSWALGECENYSIAILTGADCCSQQPPSPASPTFFKVLFMGTKRNDHRHYRLRTFSFGDTSWSRPTKCFDYAKCGAIGPPVNRNAVVCRGTVYWQFRTLSTHHVLVGVHAETGHTSVTKIPAPINLYHKLRLLNVAIDGSPTFLFFDKEDLRLEIWISRRQACGEPDWLCTRAIELRLPKPQQIFCVIYNSLGYRSGMVLMQDLGGGVHLLDLRTGSMEEVTNRFSGIHCLSVLPLEMDWPALFMSRLGGQWDY